MTHQAEDQSDCQTFLGDIKIKESISITGLCSEKRSADTGFSHSAILSSAILGFVSLRNLSFGFRVIDVRHNNMWHTFCFRNDFHMNSKLCCCTIRNLQSNIHSKPFYPRADCHAQYNQIFDRLQQYRPLCKQCWFKTRDVQIRSRDQESGPITWF